MAAERHLPKNLCPLIKSSYGLALTDMSDNLELALAKLPVLG